MAVPLLEIAYRSLFLVLCFVFSLGAQADDRPNVLWIVLDDLGPELGCYGTPHVSTPAIDALSREGVRYTRCFSTSPVCSSSRSAFVTGMYQTSINAHQHRTREKKPLMEGVKTVMQQFGEAGYFVCDLSASGKKRTPKRDYNFTLEKGVFDGHDWADREEGQPFFAQVQIHEPHRPFVRDPQEGRADKMKLSAKYPNHPVIRQDMADYLATVEAGDRRVAEILQRLQTEGLKENTLILLFGDHGRPHVWGKQWLYDDGLHVPLVVSGPGIDKPGTANNDLISLIDIAPACLIAAGIEPYARTEGVDFLAKDFKGRPFIIGARDRCGEAVDRIRAVRNDRYKYIRNFYPDKPYSQISSYKVLGYPATTVLDVLHVQGKLEPAASRMMAPTRPAEELYDIEADPDELNNLAAKSEHRETLLVMRGQLDAWIQATGDLGAIGEGDKAYYDAIVDEKRRWYEKTQQRRGLDPDGPAEVYLNWWARKIGAD